MKISVVTPTFNAITFLEGTLASIHNQTGCELESIVVDGGSSDGSAELLRGYGDKLAWWVSEPDEGAYDAVNKGFAHATGEVFAWLNASDLYTPWTLATVANIFSTFPQVQWLTTLRPISIDEDGQFICMPLFTGFSRHSLLKGHIGLPTSPYTIQQESTFWRRELWEAAGGCIPPDFGWAGDLALWAKFFEYAPLYGVNVPLAAFRQHREQRSRAVRYGEEALEVIRSAHKQPHTPHQFTYGIIQPRLKKSGYGVNWELHLVQGNKGKELLSQEERKDQALVAKEAKIEQLAAALEALHPKLVAQDQELIAKEAEIRQLAVALETLHPQLVTKDQELLAKEAEINRLADALADTREALTENLKQRHQGTLLRKASVLVRRKLAYWWRKNPQALPLSEQTQTTSQADALIAEVAFLPASGLPITDDVASLDGEAHSPASLVDEEKQLQPGRKSVAASRRCIWVAHHQQSHNIGDYACNPFLYLTPPEALDVEVRCISLTSPELSTLENQLIVLGGGGLLNPWCRDAVMYPLLAAGNSLIAWGIGHHVDNRFTDTQGRRWEGDPAASLENYGKDYAILQQFTQVGVRDFGAPWPYLPCATCLHPDFDQTTPAPVHPAVVYEHADFPPIPIGDFPKRNNRGQSEMSDVLAFLATGETVITNSFHGAYWALLLNRRVLIYEPWCSKFFTFPQPLMQAGAADWRTKLPLATGFPGYLQTCRELNHSFAERFWEHLKSESS